MEADDGVAAETAAPRRFSLPPRLREWIFHPSALKLAFELLVVFVGVTLAFWLENWREERQRREASQAVYRALADEVRRPARGGRAMEREIYKGLTEWVERYRRGEKPVPYVYMYARSPRPPTGVWEASLASGLITLIDSRLLFCLARYYKRLESSGETHVVYRQFAETEVLPYLSNPEWFYEENGRMKPKYLGNMYQIARWHDEHVRLVSEAKQLLRALEGHEAPPQC